MEEESFRHMDLSFHNGRKIPYLFEIISYYGNELEETNIIKDEVDYLHMVSFLILRSHDLGMKVIYD